MSQHNEVGKIGEDLAKKYLEEKGYKILEQNYRTRFAEIDLVAQNKNVLTFVEVRTKIGEQWGSPEDTINKNKLRKVLWNAKSYIGFKNWNGSCRIDAVCIVLNRDMSVSRLTHHENIIS
jgi:putative endonuclease